MKRIVRQQSTSQPDVPWYAAFQDPNESGVHELEIVWNSKDADLFVLQEGPKFP